MAETAGKQPSLTVAPTRLSDALKNGKACRNVQKPNPRLEGSSITISSSSALEVALPAGRGSAYVADVIVITRSLPLRTVRSFKRLLLTLACSLGLFAQGDFYLKDGDIVVFYGDSITDQRLYTTFTEAYVLTRFPKLNVRFIHSGWPGDQVDGGAGGPIDVRLARDVLAYRPTVVTIMLGMNDGRYRAFDPSVFQAYSNGYEHIVKVLKGNTPNVRITAVQPSPYDDVTRSPQFEGGYNSVLIRYGSFVQEFAAREHLQCADLNSSVVAMLLKANATDSALAQKLIPDRVHPAAATHFIMAQALLKAWNAPAVVSAVEIDAPSHMLQSAVNTSVSVLSDDHDVAWTQIDTALPMPIEKFPSKELVQLVFSSSRLYQCARS